MSVQYFRAFGVCRDCVALLHAGGTNEGNAVKVWSGDKLLLCEVVLGHSLSAAAFLNDRCDLLVAFLGHLFRIRGHKSIAHYSTVQYIPVHCRATRS